LGRRRIRGDFLIAQKRLGLGAEPIIYGVWREPLDSVRGAGQGRRALRGVIDPGS
jgi:hypothetical protein